MQYLLPLFYFLISLAAIRYFRFFRLEIGNPWIPSALFSLKIVAGMVMLWLYRTYFDEATADVYRFFNDAIILNEFALNYPKDFIRHFILVQEIDYQAYPQLLQVNNWGHQNSLFEDNSRFLILVHTFVLFFSRSYIEVHLIIFNLFSFIGLFGIYHFVKTSFPKPRNQILLIAVIFLFPSALFWLSGLTKESLVVGFVGITLFALGKVGNKQLKGLSIIALILGLIGILLSRKFLLAIILLFSIAYLFNIFTKKEKVLFPYFIIFVSSIIFILLTDYLFTSFNPISTLIEKHNGFRELAIFYKSESLIGSQSLESVKDLIHFLPIGLLNVFSRPFIFEAKGMMQIAAAIENILLLFVMVWFFLSHNKNVNNNKNWYLLFIAISWLSIIAISVPVLGAISRYRVIPIIFLLIFFIKPINISWLTKNSRS